MFIIPQLIAFSFVMAVENQDCYGKHVFIRLFQFLKYYNVRKKPTLRCLSILIVL